MRQERIKFQKQRWIDGCARLLVERKIGKLTTAQYMTEMARLSRICPDYLQTEPSARVAEYTAIKKRSSELENTLRKQWVRCDV